MTSSARLVSGVAVVASYFFASAALAQSVYMTITGDVFGPSGALGPFAAVLSYDPNTSFAPYGTLAGAYEANGSLGTIDMMFNGQSDLDAIHTIYISQNEDYGNPGTIFSPPTHVYQSAFIFYGSKYIFDFQSYGSPIPYTWTGGLVPTPSDPIPFTAPGYSIGGSITSQYSGIGFENLTYTLSDVAPVPEPIPLGLMTLGVGAAVAVGRVRRKEPRNKQGGASVMNIKLFKATRWFDSGPGI